jgi:ATP-dependent Clp protease adapter protein ClpS
MAHYMTPATVADNCRMFVLHDDCRLCAKYIVALQGDFGYPKWSAQRVAHQWHTRGHSEDEYKGVSWT